jgi:ABC-2 type transport system ATP-binding protein
VLELREVSRAFGSLQALDKVSFQVKPGRLTGFVGANGAGKTTAMRIIMGVLSMDSGEVVFGGKPATPAVARRFGYMPEERGLYPKMGIREQLVFFGQLHGLDQRKAQQNADDLLERLGLAARAGDLVEKLSLGNQQRAQIAAALVHEPSALILDEPFSGLDPMAVETVMGVLRDFAARGAPILFSSHQLDVVERITDDLVIISGGQIKAHGATAALREQHAGARYRLVLPAASPAGGATVAGVPGVGAVTEARIGDTRTEAQPNAVPGSEAAGGPGPTGAGNTASGRVLEFDASGPIAQEVLAVALALGPVDEFRRVIPSLSEVFKEVVA